MKHLLLNYLNNLKVTVLTLITLGSFGLISSGWHRFEDTNSTTKCQVAAIILITMYALIVFELVNRNLAALIGAAMSIAAYDSLIGFADADEILKWVDLDTLALLFGMMIIVNVLTLSGVFDFLAVWSYKCSKGHFWLLITLVSFITGILSALVDNVSTMLLMAPTLIKLSELQGIDPRYLLMITVIASNIGGCATPIGDPPNLIVIGSELAESTQVTFASFTGYVTPLAFLALVMVLIYLRLIYKSEKSFQVKHKPNRAISSGQRADSREGSTIMDNNDQFEVSFVSAKLANPLNQVDDTNAAPKVEDLMRIYAIKSNSILVKSMVVLTGAITLFFLQSLPGINMTLGSISLFAGLTLLIMCSSTKILKTKEADGDSMREEADEEEEEVDLFEEVISNIEWPTLIFFFALFITMEVMNKLGLTLFMGEQVNNLINLIPPGQWRSIGATTIVLWFSGFGSSCLDNIPFTLVMVKVLRSMVVENSESLQEKPLMFALVLGACLGGNATLIGASCNLITAGIAGRRGYPITFNSFFKFAAPITVLTLIISNIYLIVVFEVLKL